MIDSLPQTFCLDGTRIRRIREEKSFTQLYVAKVVGVTSDTISRWENNRYPSVKRQNALLLAQALETDLENILRTDASDEPCEMLVEEPCGQGTGPDAESSGDGALRSRVSSKVIRHVLFIFVLSCILLALFKYSSTDTSTVAFEAQAQRHLSSYAAPSAVVPVRIRLRTEGQFKGFVLKESFPRGWKLVQSSPAPSSLDNEHGMVRWIIRPGQIPPLISYVLAVPAQAAFDSQGHFEGRVTVTGGGRDTIAGDSSLMVLDRHWADDNGDYVIDDVEVLKSYEALEEMSGIHLDWDVIVAIWDAGSYLYDPVKGEFHPQRPLEQADPSSHLPAENRPGLNGRAIMASCL